MTVTRVSRTKRSSDCAVGTLEFEFKEDSRNGRVSDWLRKICFRDVPTTQSDDRLVRETRVSVILIFYLCTICVCVYIYIYIYVVEFSKRLSTVTSPLSRISPSQTFQSQALIKIATV